MILAAAALVAVQTPAYRVELITTIETPEGGCVAINDKGEVLGHRQPRTGMGTAFVWKDGKFTELPTQEPEKDGATGFSIKGIDNKGTVIGTRWRAQNGEQEDSGFKWHRDTGLEEIKVDGAGFIPSAISSDGLIAGVLTREDGSHTLGLLDTKGVFKRVMTVNSWGYDAEATAISNDGVIVGAPSYGMTHAAYRIVPGKDIAFLSSTVSSDLKDGQSLLPTRVFDINNFGMSVGTINRSHIPGEALEGDGVVWSAENTFSVIGPGIKPLSINDSGVVVGFRSMLRPIANFKAIIWDREKGVRELNQMVPKGSPKLASAVCINNSGQILCRALRKPDWYLLSPAGT